MCPLYRFCFPFLRRKSKQELKSIGTKNENKNGFADMRPKRSTLTIREVLQHAEGSETFLRFCQSQFASENLLFWLHAEKFSMLMNKNSALKLEVQLSNDTIVEQARKVYERFLKPGATQWVCIDIETVRDIEEMLDDTPSLVDHRLFMQAQEETLQTLEQDLMPRFVKDVVVEKSFKASSDLIEDLDEKLTLKKPEFKKSRHLLITAASSSIVGDKGSMTSNGRVVPDSPSPRMLLPQEIMAS